MPPDPDELDIPEVNTPSPPHESMAGFDPGSSELFTEFRVRDPPPRAKRPFKPLPDYPSPGKDRDGNLRFEEDKQRIIDVIQSSIPEAVRAAVRRLWQNTILGSHFHEGFILNVVLNRADEATVARTTDELGHVIVPGNHEYLLRYFYAQDYEEHANLILSRCNDQFLDKALEKRLQTIPPRALINALARAERLGYEQSDILEENPERVVGGVERRPFATPSQAQQPPAQASYTSIPTRAPAPAPAPAPAQVPIPAQQVPRGHIPANNLTCPRCAKTFASIAFRDLHISKQVCVPRPTDNQSASFSCPLCGQSFKTKQGQLYHELNKVCETAAKRNSESARASPKQGATPVPPPAAAPVSVHVYQQPASQSSQPNAAPSHSSFATSSPGNDPYAHLTPQKRAEFEEELRQAEAAYAPRFAEVEAIRDPVLRKSKLDSLHNSFSTKQSMVRKKYGIKLRVRRSRAEIEAQQNRMGLAEEGAAKRQRLDNGGHSRSPSVTMSQTPSHSRVAIVDMSGGLGGSAATPATVDPTSGFTSVNQPKSAAAALQSDNSLSSLQRKGYRVSSHKGQGSPSRVTSDIRRQSTGSRGEPIELDGSDSISGSASPGSEDE